MKKLIIILCLFLCSCNMTLKINGIETRQAKRPISHNEIFLGMCAFGAGYCIGNNYWGKTK